MTIATTYPVDGVVTERLILRTVSEENTSELQNYHNVNRMHLQPWEPLRPEGFFELHAAADRLREMTHQTAMGTALHLMLFEREHGQLVGDCNFTNIVRGPFQACFIGFSVAKMFEGQGLMLEGLTTAIEYVFTILKLHRIMANHRPENARCEQLLARLGFEKEGVARSYLKINGSWSDHVLTSLVNPADLA